MTPDKLKALADTPGYGRAAEALRRAGLWDEERDPTLPRWIVRCEGTVSETVDGAIEIYARDEAAARRIALERRSDIEWNNGSETYELESWEIEEVKRHPECALLDIEEMEP